MEGDLQKIYKSAVESMKQEIVRLHLTIQHQEYSKKLEKLQKTASNLKLLIEKTHHYPENETELIEPLSEGIIKEQLSRKCNYELLQSQITQMTQKINIKKNKNLQEQESLEQALKEMNSNLYIMVLKFKDVYKQNVLLKKEHASLTQRRKALNKTYAKITNNLIKEPSLTEKLEMIDRLEQKTKKKAIKISILENIIEEVKAKKLPENPEVKVLWAQIVKKEEL